MPARCLSFVDSSLFENTNSGNSRLTRKTEKRKMIIGRVEGEEEEGFDQTMSVFLSQPSSPLSLYGSGLGYEYGGFTIDRSPSPPRPLSPLWNFSDDVPIPENQHCFGGLRNPIPAKAPHINESSRRRYRLSVIRLLDIRITTFVSRLTKRMSLLENHNRKFRRPLLVKLERQLLTLRRLDEFVVYPDQNNLDLNLVLNERASIYMSALATCSEILMAWLVDYEDLMITDEQKWMLKHLYEKKSREQHFSCNLNEAAAPRHIEVSNFPRYIYRILQMVNEVNKLFNMCIQNNSIPSSVYPSLSAEPVTEVEKDSEFNQRDTLASNQYHEVLAMLESDEIEEAGGCEVQGIPIVIRDQRNVSSSKYYTTSESTAISLEDLQQHLTMTRDEAAKSFGGSSISLEDIQQHSSMTREKAAESLGVSISTLKRACREHGIPSWLHLKRRKKSAESPLELKKMDVTKQDIVTSGSRKTDLCDVNPVKEVQFVTIKAKYIDKMIKFQLASLSKIEKLEEEVANRLKLEVGSFSIEYVDEANDQILLACSEDLQYCIDTWASLGKTDIRMLVKLLPSDKGSVDVLDIC